MQSSGKYGRLNYFANVLDSCRNNAITPGDTWQSGDRTALQIPAE
jgi:hypothetical protein